MEQRSCIHPGREKMCEAKYNALEKKYSKELAEREQSWETRVQQVEEGKKELAEEDHSWEITVIEVEEEKEELEDL